MSRFPLRPARPAPRLPGSSHTRIFWMGMALLVLLAVPYSIAVYTHPGEDIFITLRYARNFLEGRGLAFSPGTSLPAAEGYSNLLWTLTLSAVGALGARLDVAARLLSHAALALLILAMPLFRRRGAGGGAWERRSYLEWFAPLAVFSQPILHYVSDWGLETTCHTLMLFLAGAALVHRRHGLASLALLAVALNRPEGFAYWFCFLPLAAWDAWRVLREDEAAAEAARAEAERAAADPSIRWRPAPGAGAVSGGAEERDDRRSRQHRATMLLVRYMLPWAAGMAVLLSWRLHYYNALLPNTVYAKLPDWSPALLRWQRVWQFSEGFTHLPLVVPVLVALALRGRFMRAHARELVVAGMGIAAVVGFGAIVGSVPERFRHLAPSIPFFLVAAQLVVLAVRYGTARFPVRVASALAGLLLLANFWQPTNHGDAALRLHVRTMAYLRAPQWERALIWYLHPPALLNADVGRWMAANLPPNALVAADQVGQLAYECPQPILDLLGLNDRGIWKLFGRPEAMADYVAQSFAAHAMVEVRITDAERPTEFTQPIPFLDDMLRSEAWLSRYRLRKVFTWRARPTPQAFALYTRHNAAVTIGDLPALVEADETTGPVEVIPLGFTREELSQLTGMEI